MFLHHSKRHLIILSKRDDRPTVLQLNNNKSLQNLFIMNLISLWLLPDRLTSEALSNDLLTAVSF
jgi:hypothetical protein